MRPARKVSLFHREIREWISPPAFEILVGTAEVLSEGSFDNSQNDPMYLGSVGVSVRLSQCDAYIRGPLDAAAARRLTQMITHDPVAQEVLSEVAHREAERVAGCPLYEVQMEISADHRGDEILIHLDVEGRVAPRSQTSPVRLGRFNSHA